MDIPGTSNVTQLLIAWRTGDPKALDELVPLIYTELRRIASRYVRRESRNRTIQTTDLVHEAYLRLVSSSELTWQNRAHFFAIAARLMRQILINYARKRRAHKRGEGQPMVSLEESAVLSREKSEEILALDEALQRLAGVDERMARIVELRYFTGLTIEETAEALSISPATVKREWQVARAWLYQEMTNR